jgi:hypothetical protein
MSYRVTRTMLVIELGWIVLTFAWWLGFAWWGGPIFGPTRFAWAGGLKGWLWGAASLAWAVMTVAVGGFAVRRAASAPQAVLAWFVQTAVAVIAVVIAVIWSGYSGGDSLPAGALAVVAWFEELIGLPLVVAVLIGTGAAGTGVARIVRIAGSDDR